MLPIYLALGLAIYMIVKELANSFGELGDYTEEDIKEGDDDTTRGYHFTEVRDIWGNLEAYEIIGITEKARREDEKGGLLDIPREYNGKPVISIAGRGMFYFLGNVMEEVTTVRIPNTIKIIGHGIFMPRKNKQSLITSIEFETGSQLTEIWSKTFSYCNSLESIVLPDSVTSIGDYAFQGCSSLTTITLPSSLKEIGWYTFDGCSQLSTIIFPSNLETIRPFAFQNCSSLKQLVLPDTLKNIYGNAFTGSGLGEVALQGEVTVNGSFVGCESLEYILADSGVKFVSTPFKGCTKVIGLNFSGAINSLKDLFGSDSENGPNIQTIHIGNEEVTNLTFQGYKNFVEIELPNVVTIGDFAFQGCKNLTKVVALQNVITIKDYAFNDCEILANVTGLSKLESIGIGAFANCPALAKLTLPKTVYYIGLNAFQNSTKLSIEIDANNPYFCSYENGLYLKHTKTGYPSQLVLAYDRQTITSFKIYDNVKSIRSNALAGCGLLTEITLPKSLTSIEANAFSGTPIKTLSTPLLFSDRAIEWSIGNLFSKEYLRKVTITAGEFISSNTFLNCENLHEIVFDSDELREFAKGCLQRCSNLRNLTIPFIGDTKENPTVTYIGYLFGYDSSDYHPNLPLNRVTINGSTYLPEQALRASPITYIDFGTVTTIGENALAQCSGLYWVDCSKIVEIKDYAFQYCSQLYTITFGADIKRIGAWAFFNCGALSELIIPDDAELDVINTEAFAYTNFASIKVPYSKLMGQHIFSNCNGLSMVDLSNFTEIPRGICYGCKALTQIIFNTNTTSIDEYAFADCLGLKSVKLPRSLKWVFPNIFEGCIGLENFEFPIQKQDAYGEDFCFGTFFGAKAYEENSSKVPASLGIVRVFGGEYNKIPDHFFYQCTSLQTLTISEIDNFGESILKGCTSLTTLRIPFVGQRYNPLDTEDNKEYLGYFFGGKNWQSNGTVVPKSLKNVTIDNSWEEYHLPDLCFARCENIGGIRLPKNTTILGTQSFYKCKSLEQLDFSETNITTILPEAFSECSKLIGIKLPNTVVEIQEYVFYGCTSLKSCNIPPSIKELQTGLFQNCSSIDSVSFYNAEEFQVDNLTGISIPKQITKFYSNVFSGCSSLEMFSFPPNVEKIEQGLFAGCTSLTEFYFSGVGEKMNVKEIGIGAFEGCVGLTRITIPTGVENINQLAFNGCSGLVEVKIAESVKTIGREAFSNCKSLTEVDIPTSVTELGKSLLQGCTSLSSLTIPFVGGKALAGDDNAVNSNEIGNWHFGYIFGAENSEEQADTIPNGLIVLQITPDDNSSIGIHANAFKGVAIQTIYISMNVYKIGKEAFDSKDIHFEIEFKKEDCPWANGWHGENINEKDNITWGVKESFYPTINNILYRIQSTTNGNWATVWFQNKIANADLGTIEIPSTVLYNGTEYTVIKIISNAFEDHTSLISATIPDSVTTICRNAFANTGLKAIDLTHCEIIEEKAFANCSELEIVTFGKSLKEISSQTFSGSPIKTITFEEKNDYFYVDDDKVVLLKRYIETNNVGSWLKTDLVLCLTGNEVETYRVPEISSISSWAFYKSKIKFIILPWVYAGTTIGEGAFSECENLTGINIPKNITTIPKKCFANNPNLKTVSFEDDQAHELLSIEDQAFQNCSSLQEIYLPGIYDKIVGTTAICKMGEKVFEGCKNLKIYLRNGSVEGWNESWNGGRPFYTSSRWCIPYLTYESINDKICKVVGFNSASSDYITIPVITSAGVVTAIQSLQDPTQTEAKKIAVIRLPCSIVEINQSAFRGFDNLVEINIPDSVSKMGSAPFWGCETLVIYCEANEETTQKHGWPTSWNSSYADSECPVVWSSGTNFTASDGYIYAIDSNNVRYRAMNGEAYAIKQSYVIRQSYFNTNQIHAKIQSKVKFGSDELRIYGIADGAFDNIQLNALGIPESLQYFGSNNFDSVKRNPKILIIKDDWDQDPVFETDEYGALYQNKKTTQQIDGKTQEIVTKTLIMWPTYATGETDETEKNGIVVKDSTTKIKSKAFQYSSLKKITIPNSVTHIEKEALYGCNSLEELILPFIGEYSSTSLGYNSENTVFGFIFGETNQNDYNHAKQYYASNEFKYYRVPRSLQKVVITKDEQILYGAFSDCKYINEVILPRYLKVIDRRAFEGCSNLQYIIIPDLTTSIYDQAFYHCDYPLGFKVFMSSGVKNIGENAFITSYESGVKMNIYVTQNSESELPFSKEGQKPIVINGQTFQQGWHRNWQLGNTVIYGFKRNLKLQVEPFGDYGWMITKYSEDGSGWYVPSVYDNKFITAIGDGVFKDSEITDVDLTYITSIGEYAFSGCNRLRRVSIPSTVKKIGKNAFYGCWSAVIRLYMQQCPEEWDESWSGEDGKATVVQSDGSLGDLNHIYSGNDDFDYILSTFNKTAQIKNYYGSKESLKLTSYEYRGESYAITSIAPYAFYGANMTTLQLPDTLTKVGQEAFMNCNKLQFNRNKEEKYLGSESNPYFCLISIGSSATSYESDVVKIICDQAFKDCTKLTTVSIPKDARYIGPNIFVGCSQLQSIKIPNFVGDVFDMAGITGQFDRLFDRKRPPNTLTTIVLTGTSLWPKAFSNFTSLTKVVFEQEHEDWWSDIGEKAFFNCYNLQEIQLPFIGLKKTLDVDQYSESSNERQFGYIFGGEAKNKDYYYAVDNSEKDNYPNTFTWIPKSLKTVIINNINSLQKRTFKGCDQIESIQTPPLESIQEEVFYGCSQLESVNLSPSLQSIPARAFYSCSKLIVSMPKNTTSIKEEAFSGCASLIEMDLQNITTWEDSVFSGCTSLRKVITPKQSPRLDGIPKIPNKMFCDCEALTFVVIPRDTEIIGVESFSGCSSLSYIEVPSAVKTIYDKAFYGCSNLSKLYGLVGVTTFGSYVFQKCSNLTDFNFHAPHQLGKGILEGCEKLQNLYIDFTNLGGLEEPTDASPINTSNFQLPTIIHGYDLDDSQCSIPQNKIEVSGIRQIVKKMFKGFNCVKTINFPTDIQYIREGAFSKCHRLISVSPMQSVKKIGNEAFFDCYELNEINIPDTLNELGASAFENCKKLTKIVIPYQIKQINNRTFYGCKNLNQIILPNYTSDDCPGIQMIGVDAFNSCGLSSINLPNSLSKIWEDAFKDSNIKEVYIDDLNNWYKVDFINENSNPLYCNASESKLYLNNIPLKEIVFPEELEEIKPYAFSGNWLEEVKILGSPSISTNSFLKCDNLTKVYFYSELFELGEVFPNNNIITYYYKKTMHKNDGFPYGSSEKSVRRFIGMPYSNMDFLGFTFNGKHSYLDLNVLRVTDGDRLSQQLNPDVDDMVASISGSDGQYFFGSNHKSRKFQIKFAFNNLTDVEMREWRRFCSNKELGDLIFDEEPYKVYKAKITGASQLSTMCFDETIKVKETIEGEETEVEKTIRVYKGEGDIEFTCYWPYAHTPDQTTKVSAEIWGEGYFPGDGRISGTYYSEDYELWVDTSSITEAFTNGMNNGDIPAPFVYSYNPKIDPENEKSALKEIAKDSTFQIGDDKNNLKITILQGTYSLKWDSKTGIVSGTDSSGNEATRKPIPYSGNSLGGIPVGGTDIIPRDGTLTYHYWYY